MEDINAITIGQMFRHFPAESALVSVLPVALVLIQLGNGFLNGLPLPIAIGFGIGLLAGTTMLFQYRFVRFRRQSIERHYLPHLQDSSR